jgi:hypothetical protein
MYRHYHPHSTDSSIWMRLSMMTTDMRKCKCKMDVCLIIKNKWKWMPSTNINYHHVSSISSTSRQMIRTAPGHYHHRLLPLSMSPSTNDAHCLPRMPISICFIGRYRSVHPLPSIPREHIECVPALHVSIDVRTRRWKNRTVVNRS